MERCHPHIVTNALSISQATAALGGRFLSGIIHANDVATVKPQVSYPEANGIIGLLSSPPTTSYTRNNSSVESSDNGTSVVSEEETSCVGDDASNLMMEPLLPDDNNDVPHVNSIPRQIVFNEFDSIVQWAANTQENQVLAI